MNSLTLNIQKVWRLPNRMIQDIEICSITEGSVIMRSGDQKLSWIYKYKKQSKNILNHINPRLGIYTLHNLQGHSSGIQFLILHLKIFIVGLSLISFGTNFHIRGAR